MSEIYKSKKKKVDGVKKKDKVKIKESTKKHMLFNGSSCVTESLFFPLFK